MTATRPPSTAGEPQRAAGLVRARIKARGAAGMGPHAHLAGRRDHLASLTWSHCSVTPQSATIGAIVSGIDLGAHLDDATIAEVRQALLSYKVLVFRDQDLTADAQLAVARRFGELEVHPFLAGPEDRPELVRLAKDATVGGYENAWHSDVSWRLEPALGAILRAVEVPPSGGDTLFADMGAAYSGLDDEVRDRIETMTAVHDFVLTFGQALPADERAVARQQYPPAEHPVVRTHPETGERILYVNGIFTSHLVGLDEAESEELLAVLFRQAEVPEYQFRLQWQPGTVVFWDNRSTQHYATSDYWPHRRVMERAAIAGDRPA